MNFIKRSRNVLLLFLLCSVCLPAAVAAEPVKVAILPFEILAEKDYTFLQRGIVQMLTSRLSSPGKVTVLDPEATARALATAGEASGERRARQVGETLQADYTIHGSLTVLGESVSIDAAMLDLSGNRAPMTFFKQTQGMGEVIPEINRMATEINSEVFGVAARPPTPAVAPAPTPAPTVGGTPAPPVSDMHRHPERLLEEARRMDPIRRPAGSRDDLDARPHPLNPAFAAAAGSQPGADAGFWKSQTYNHLINAVAVGDLDGDGMLETVVAAPDNLFIYRFAEGRQQTVAEIPAGRYVRNISVDVADINGNGTPEIFVTAFSVGLNAVASYVLEFDGQTFRTVVEKSRYYYSVVDHPTFGRILLGQLQLSDASTPFDAPIHQMVWNGQAYVPERQLLAGRLANLLGLAYGDILNEGGESYVAYDPKDRLRVITANGRVQHTSSDVYGGTPLYFAMPPLGPGDSPASFYLPTRIRTVDLDGNGRYEVLVAHNRDSAGRLLVEQRFFGKGTVEALSWDGLGLAPVWRTRQLSGRVQDFLVADFNNDGILNLLVVIIAKEGAIIFTDAQSALVAFELNVTPAD